MADVAQLVEPRFVVPVVVSSSLIVRPSKESSREGAFFVFRREIGENSEELRIKKHPGGCFFTAKQRNILTSKGSGSDRGEFRCRWDELLETA